MEALIKVISTWEYNRATILMMIEKKKKKKFSEQKHEEGTEQKAEI